MTTDERELWKQKDAGDLDARNELVVRYEKTALSLVWSRYNGNIIHRNDWESEILYFLIAAVDGYSLGRGTQVHYFFTGLSTAGGDDGLQLGPQRCSSGRPRVQGLVPEL